MIKLICIALFTLCVLLNSYAQRWYQGTGIVTLANITPEEARRRALETARREVLSQNSLEITGTTIRKTEQSSAGEIYDNFFQFTRTVTRGMIVEETILVDSIEASGGEPNIYHYRITIEAKVKTITGSPDPNFEVNLKLDKSTYHDGEEIKMTIASARDCYITVFNLYSIDSLIVVFPSKLDTNNHIKAGQRLTIPPKDSGWKLIVNLLPSRESDQEAVLVIAVKENIPFYSEEFIDRQGLISLNDALIAINQWLCKFNADQYTQDFEIYSIQNR